MIWSWFHRHPRLVDRFEVAFLIVLVLGVAHNGNDRAAAVTLGLCETVPLLWRRRWPFEVALVVAAVSVAMIIAGVWVIPLQLGVALYTLSSLRDTRESRTVVAGAVVAVAIAVIALGGFEFGAGAARVVFLIAAALLGNSIGSRRAYVREIEQKAERLERERDSATRRAAAEEQARIARELHEHAMIR